jgi:quercetin dioxygenase-like cupin family protein/extradiol dioxygenase family protein
MTQPARLVGINHVALEVGDLEQALAFYGAIFAIRGVEHEPGMAFLDMGDQFLALSQGRTGPPDATRHFGLVVDDKQRVRDTLGERGIPVSPPPRLDFHDPWGNQVQVVDYRDIQFSKAPAVLRGMELDGLDKRQPALAELREKGLAGAAPAGAGDRVRVIPQDELPFSVIAHEFVGEQHGANVTFLLVDAPPGAGPRRHRHPYEEIIVTQEGEATFTLGDESRVVGPGEVIVIPAGQEHGFTNSGDGPLRQIDIHASPHFATEWL